MAYLAGARFDTALSEIQKGNIVPKWGQRARAIAKAPDHREL
jgi:hypothetical protein